MVHHPSSIWLALGIAVFPATVNAICTGGVLCELNTLAGLHQRFWGTCVQDTVATSMVPQYVALAVDFKEFGMVTPTKGFELSTIQPAQGVFTFSTPDRFVSYWQGRAKSRLWIHTLLPTTNTGFPTWLKNSAWSKSQMISIIQDYVSTVAAHYRGRVYAWDVVSEILNDNGSWRNNIFYTYLGPDFVEIALVAARAADPNAKLYIEEYGVEYVNAKSDALFYLAQNLKNNGVPLDGIGFEGHVITPLIQGAAGIMSNTRRFESLDLDWAYTQLGVRIVGSITSGRQSEDYHAMLTSCMNSSRCVGVLTSGITDLTTIEGTGIWGGPPWTETLFDASYTPTRAYNAVANYISEVTVDGNYI